VRNAGGVTTDGSADVQRGRSLAVCYGTRPQVIKASVLIDALAQRWPLITIDTGQHYDYELNRLLYEQLEVPTPTYCLDVGAADPARQLSRIITRAAAILARERPWAVVVLGDTNSTLGTAIAAAQMRIPVVHVEAGLRAGDHLMIEEINRKVVDAIAVLLCAPTASAAAQLERESVRGRIEVTGDVARDVLMRFACQAPPARTLPWWPVPDGDPFVFATLHRAELVSDARALRCVMTALNTLDVSVVLAAHPRLRGALRQHGLQRMCGESLRLVPPLGYFEALACVRDARAVVTDSGGIQREAYWLGTPCITTRVETEWKETVDVGANVLVTPSSAVALLPPAVQRWTHGGASAGEWNRDAYGTGDAATRICAAIAAVALPS
jgi:UDP-N-acetylglucosamine 2-epimerase